MIVHVLWFQNCCTIKVKKSLNRNVIRKIQKQVSKDVLRRKCSENMQQIYRRTPMPKCDFNKVAKQSNFIEITLRHGCSPVNLLHNFRTPLPKNTSGRLLLKIQPTSSQKTTPEKRWRSKKVCSAR